MPPARHNGQAAGPPKPTLTEQVLSFLQGRKAPCSTAEIMQGLGLEKAQVHGVLYRMQEKKLVKETDEGWAAK